MARLKALLRRFKHDERGAFLALFGIMTIALVATGGAVVDFVSVDQARNRAQLALDSSVLALQPDIYTKTEAEIMNAAQALLTQRLANSSITATVDEITINEEDGSLFLNTSLTVPTYFVDLVGVDYVSFNVSAQATRKKLFVEVAFVLDNSGSMGAQSRMTNLKKATKSATNILFYGADPKPSGATKLENTKISVVPFAYFVNIGSQYKDASWMDQAGVSSISNDNFDDDNNDATPFNGAVDRFALYDSMINTSWKGCVEARPGQYGIDDTPPSTSDPDSLFVPVFAPDNPDKKGYYNKYLKDSGGACPNNPKVWKLSHRERQERLCKYTGAKPTDDYGPNGYCLDTSILPLTDDVSSIVSKIDAMKSNGWTNIHQGAMWGFHALSPTAPFSEGADYDQATSKVMIIMTDGQNTFPTSSNMNGSRILSAYGHLSTGRLGAPGVNTGLSNTATMNALTVKTCEAARAEGIVIYSIGLEAPNSATKNMLRDCATDSSKVFFPSAASELNSVFKTIAEQLSNLRIES